MPENDVKNNRKWKKIFNEFFLCYSGKNPVRISGNLRNFVGIVFFHSYFQLLFLIVQWLKDTFRDKTTPFPILTITGNAGNFSSKLNCTIFNLHKILQTAISFINLTPMNLLKILKKSTFWHYSAPLYVWYAQLLLENW